MRDRLAFCRAHAPWALAFTEELARLESPTTDKAAIDRCGAALARAMAAAGGRVETIPQPVAGDHLRAEFGTGEGQVLMLGHFDTVWPVGHLARMPVERRGGRLYGPGVFDMKAGIAIALLAARALFEAGTPPPHRVVMLWTTDEETGSATSRALLEAEARRSRAVLVLEPSLPGGTVKTSRKGVGEFRLTVTGRAAHAGVDPRQGVSAIHEMAALIRDIERLQDLDRGVSVNVGTIQGGTRSNVTAERAVAEVDVRVPTMGDAERVSSALRALAVRHPDARLEISGGVNRPPMERTAGVAGLFEKARTVAAALGVDLREGGTGGGSDGNFTAALGVPTLDGLGAVGDGAHAAHEHVELEPFPVRAALVAGLVLQIQ